MSYLAASQPRTLASSHPALRPVLCSTQTKHTVLDVDRIIIPVNHDNRHWTCCMIDLKDKHLIHYDSLHSPEVTSPSCLQAQLCFYSRLGYQGHHRC